MTQVKYGEIHIISDNTNGQASSHPLSQQWQMIKYLQESKESNLSDIFLK